jgi:hypothetical protein
MGTAGMDLEKCTDDTFLQLVKKEALKLGYIESMDTGRNHSLSDSRVKY